MLVVVPVHAQSLAGPYPVPGSGGGISPNYAGAVTFTNPANVFGGAFTGDGSGLTNLPASGGGVTNGSIIGASSYLPPFKIISPVIASNVLYVSTSGNDTTAQRGNPLLPYATVTNAVASASNNDVVYVYAGTYLVKSTVLPYGVSIIGDTNGVVSLVFNQPGLAAVAGLVLTNGGNTLANFTLSVTNTPTGYDTYPLYSGNAGLSGTVTSTATNIYLYNLKVNGYSD